MKKKGYVSVGEMDLDEANEMNIPMNIFLSSPDDSEDGQWELTANNYMPRKDCSAQGQYRLVAESKEPLLEAVQKYIVPLYETALFNLKTKGANYYWQKKD